MLAKRKHNDIFGENQTCSIRKLNWLHDIQHNDTLHDDIQQNKFATLSITTLHLEYCFAECLLCRMSLTLSVTIKPFMLERQDAKYRYTECRGANLLRPSPFNFYNCLRFVYLH